MNAPRVVSARALVRLALIFSSLTASCSGTQAEKGSGTSGSPASGGSSPGTGGAANGGAADGGAANGGAANGGAAAGGASSGGGSSAAAGGGTDAGGADSGGGAGAGGAAAGTGGAMGGAGAAGSDGGGTAGSPSSGCSASGSPASGRFSVDVDGTEREYILKLPSGYDPARPYPLILAWHGRMYSADWVASGDPPQTGPYFGIETAANGGALLVAPQALESGFSNQDGRDLAFTDAMVARFRAELCVDENRIFSTGFSMGGMMTIAIGCARGDVFRAIAPMSASLQTGCADGDEPVAYWSSHGDADNTVTATTGQMARDEFASRNGCDTTTTPASREGCVANQGCDPGYPVTFCTFSGAHVPAPFAGEAIWEFFSQF